MFYEYYILLIWLLFKIYKRKYHLNGLITYANEIKQNALAIVEKFHVLVLEI